MAMLLRAGKTSVRTIVSVKGKVSPAFASRVMGAVRVTREIWAVCFNPSLAESGMAATDAVCTGGRALSLFPEVIGADQGMLIRPSQDIAPKVTIGSHATTISTATSARIPGDEASMGAVRVS